MFRLMPYALRQLRGRPWFAVTAFLTLAIGIGAPTVLFAALDAVLLQPLPFAQPDRLVAVISRPDDTVSIPTMQDEQSRSTTFVSLAAYRPWSPAQRSTDATAAYRILEVSQGFFSTLGTQFALGESWPITGNEQDCSLQVIVSGAYWKRLGGTWGPQRRTLNLDGRDFQIAGVLPQEQAIEGSYGLNQPEVFAPIGCDRDQRPNHRGSNSFQLIGRLRPHVTTAQASADLERIGRLLRKEYPDDYGSDRAGFRRSTLVIPYVEMLVGTGTKPALLLTFAACGLLLLIACANLANLLLAHHTRRRGEFATRAVLGASPVQLLKQLMVESGVLVAAGAAGGVALAYVVLKLLKTATALYLPRLAHASLSPAVLIFVVLISAAVTFLLTALPAWRTLRPDLMRDLQGAGRSSASPGLRLAGRLLVMVQLALSVVLMACAGWMIGSVYSLLHQPLGFTPDSLLLMRVTARPDHPTKQEAMQSELRLATMAEELRRLPEVESVAWTDHVPLGHAINRYGFCSDLHPEQCKLQVNINPDSYVVSSGYFSTIGQPLLEGRDFRAADDGRNPVVIVNRTLAEREWPGQSALGHRVKTGEIKGEDGGTIWSTVVGVVGDVRNYDLVSAPGPDLYLPRAEDPFASVRLVVRTKDDPAKLKKEIRNLLRRENPNVRLSSGETMREEMASEVAERAFLMQVATVFGAVALFLSIVGTYGLLAYEVSQREKEIGIRLALGSSRERIVTLLLQEEGRWLVAGVLLGLGCAVMTGYALRSQFYNAHSTSLPVLLGSVSLLALSALIAVTVPAGRASLQDPARTLRKE